jgi:hypothetical protein
MTRPTELCINDPSPPRNTEEQQFSRLRYGPILCTIILDRKREKLRLIKPMERGALKWCKEHIPRDGNDLTKEGQLLLEDPELWLDRLTFLRNVNVMHRENENTLQRTAHSCYTTKELLHPPLQETGSKTGGECSNQLCTVSRRTSGETRSPTTRNQINVIFVKRCGYHMEDSPQKKLFQCRP